MTSPASANRPAAAVLSTTDRTLVIGANHRTSSLAVRDRLFVEPEEMPRMLSDLRRAAFTQALVLSTCDRTEVVAIHDDPEDAANRCTDVIARWAEMPASELMPHLFRFEGETAVRHVFAVTASLDSVVIGEPYVLGQLKESHRSARDAGLAGADLDALVQATCAAAKRVRTETAVGQRPVSLASSAVELAKRLHGELARCRGLLIGVGDVGLSIAETLIANALGTLDVTDPRLPRGEATARLLDCHVVPFERLDEHLVHADIVIVALGTRHYVVSDEMMRSALKRRRQRPVLVIDAAVPGDAEPDLNVLDEVFLYDLNDLEKVAAEGSAFRQSEANHARLIIDEDVARFLRGRAERAAVPALSALRRHFEAVRQSALADAGGDAEKATRLLINRLLHDPSESLRDMAATGPSHTDDLDRAERLVTRLFRLQTGDRNDDG